jgi:hypothetical protein
MTEQTVSNELVASDTPISNESITSSAPSVEHITSPTEKMIPQSEVGKIAGASRKEGHDKGYERGYQEALSKFQREQQQQTNTFSEKSSAQQQPNFQEIIAKQVSDQWKKEREAQEQAAEEKRQNDYITNLGNQLRPKIDAAKQKYPDFNEKVAELHLEQIPRIFEYVNSVPNAGEVLYDLANNPHKLGILNALHAPELAIRQVHEISRSLQNNEAAQNKTMPKGPLSTIEPSMIGSQPSGEMSGQQLTDTARKKYLF